MAVCLVVGKASTKRSRKVFKPGDMVKYKSRHYKGSYRFGIVMTEVFMLKLGLNLPHPEAGKIVNVLWWERNGPTHRPQSECILNLVKINT